MADSKDYILTFGKHKGKTLAEIAKKDMKYIKYLCNYDLSYDEEDDEIITGNKYYSDYETIVINRQCLVDKCKFANLQHLEISRIEWWNNVLGLSEDDRFRILFLKKDEINLVQTANGFKEFMFYNIYLRAYQYETIIAARKFIKYNRYCCQCFSSKKMPPIGNDRINGADHNDWNSRSFHKKCYLMLKTSEFS